MTDSCRELIDQIGHWDYGMPVRLMERVLAMGAAAVPELLDALDRHEADEQCDPLWALVLLGEIRCPDAIPALIQRMRGPRPGCSPRPPRKGWPRSAPLPSPLCRGGALGKRGGSGARVPRPRLDP